MDDTAAPPSPASPAPLGSPVSPAPQPPHASGWRTLWHLLQPALLMLALLLAVLAALAGAAVWLLRSEDGTAWLLSRLPGVQAQGLRGALLSSQFEAEHFVVRWDSGRQSVTVDGFRGTGLHWRWRPEPGAWLGLAAAQLQARRVVVDTGPAGPRPVVLPRTLQWPLRVQSDRAAVAELVIDGLQFTQVTGQGLEVWGQGGSVYRAEALAFDWDRMHVQGQASLGTLPPFVLQAQASLAARAEPGATAAWTAQASAQGPLSRFDLQGTLRGVPVAGGGAAALELDAAITPLERWPLARLRARTQALDLSTLWSRAPQTSLSGSADIASSALDAPFGAEVLLDNAAAGRWNEHRLPLRRLQASVQAAGRNSDRVELRSFELALGSAREAAGQWRGSGVWQGPTLQVQSQLDALRPQGLDSRAATMQMSGPLAVTLHGLPSPQPGSATPSPPPAWKLDLKTALEGRIEASPHPVTLALDASADARRLELRELRAQAGAALAALAGTAQRGSNGEWQLRSAGSLTDFDPLPWWPGSVDSAWREGPHRLSSTWSLELRVPARLPGTDWLTLAQSLVGSGTLRVTDSMLAGMPLALTLDLGHRPGTTATPSSVRGELVLAGNRLSFDGQGDPMGPGTADHMQLELLADALPALAPLARLWPELADWVPRNGKAEASLTLDGRWPEMHSEGRASAQGLQSGALSATQLRASWRADTAADRPLAVQADVQGLGFGEQRLEQLHAELRGSWRQHQLDLVAALPLQPPRWLELLFGLRTLAGTQARVLAEGNWDPDGSGGGRWNGQVAQLVLGPWAGAGSAPAAGTPGTTWVDARELRAEVQVDGKAGLSRVRANAGRLRLADAVTLRWDDVKVDLSGAAPAFELRADIEPFALAPLLARTQPTLGWSGDLRLAARVDLRAADKLDADVVFERRDGDLRLADDSGGQAFGLSALRVALNAHDGQWLASGAFAGKTIGELNSRLQLQVRPEQRWPTAETPIDGTIEAQVSSLAIWSSWVPPGWRLSGALRTSAKVGGRIGAPEYVGEVRATDVAVRNLLQGVDVREGDATIALQGATARIERFALRGGEGRLDVSGSASLGAAPSAQLRLEAERFRVLGRIDRQLSASGKLALNLDAEHLQLDGRVHIDDGLFDLGRSDAPTLDDDVSVRQAERTPTDTPPPPAQRPRRNAQVAIDVDLGDKVRVRGRGLDTTLGGNLRIGSSAGRLTVNGIVSTAGGTYAAYGQKLAIERGSVIFSGDYDNPTLDVLALRPNLDTQVGVAITGTMQVPRVRLYSGTDMSESDKLSWLVLGRASEGLGRADSALLSRAAVALLAGEGEAPTDALLRGLGIDELSVRQKDTDVRETVISLGKQLSQRWYVGYERGVNATTGTWQLIYRIAQRFTLRAQSGLENSLDLIWVWRLNDPPLEALRRSIGTANSP